MVTQRLREILGDEAVAALPETGMARSQRHWTRFKRWAWMGTHPQAYLTARKEGKMERKVTRFSNWMRAFSTLGIGRRLTEKGIKVAMVDQGLLRLAMEAEHAALVPKSLMPDLVLHLVATPAVLELRRIYRSKPKFNKMQGEGRLRSVRETIRSLGKLPEVQMRDILTKYGEKFCEPSFSAAEIDSLIAFSQEATGEPAPAKKRRGRCDEDVCELLRQRGVLWQEIDNSGDAGPQQAVEACVQAILTNMEVLAQKRAGKA